MKITKTKKELFSKDNGPRIPYQFQILVVIPNLLTETRDKITKKNKTPTNSLTYLKINTINQYLIRQASHENDIITSV